MKRAARWVAAAAMLAGTMAFAQTVAPTPVADGTKDRPRPGGERGAMMEQMTFEKMDANGDGKVTFEEFTKANEAMLKMRFDRLDENKDGTISKEEMQKAREGMRNRMGGDRPARREGAAKEGDAAKVAPAAKDAEAK